MLAMHMANELLSVPVAGATLALAAAIVAAAAWRSRKAIESDKAPLMGVMGAFVFAAQMINFTLPGMPGTSGHLVGGVLLAILLGPSSAIVTMSAILIVQCLLFQDGGLLALGCNILNMGVVPALLGWGVYRLLLGGAQQARAWRQYLAAWAGCTIGVAGGAVLVPLQASLSGVLRISLVDFIAVMLGVHLIIGCIEGLITFGVIAYLRQVRPAALGLVVATRERLSRKTVLASLLATALLLAGAVSLFASTRPDGLEWTYKEHFAGADAPVGNSSPTVAAVDDWQSRWSLMTDYSKRPTQLGRRTEATAEGQRTDNASWPNLDGWVSLAGIAGTAVTLVVVYIVSAILRRRSCRQAPSPQNQAC